MIDEDFIADFEEKHGWTPDCAYETRQIYPPVDIIGEENIGGESRKLRRQITTKKEVKNDYYNNSCL